MKEESPEFFKLEDSDRKVLMWLKSHVNPRSVKSWIEFIAIDYKRRKDIDIDIDKLFSETVDE